MCEDCAILAHRLDEVEARLKKAEELASYAEDLAMIALNSLAREYNSQLQEMVQTSRFRQRVDNREVSNG